MLSDYLIIFWTLSLCMDARVQGGGGEGEGKRIFYLCGTAKENPVSRK